MKFNHAAVYTKRTGPYTAEEAVEAQLNIAAVGTCDANEDTQYRLRELAGMVARLIDALPSPQYSDPHHGGYKAHRERVALILGYAWEPADE